MTTSNPTLLGVTQTSHIRISPLDIPELLELIFSFFNDTTIRSVRLVCRSWHHVCELHNTQTLIFDDRTHDPKKFNEILQSLPYAGRFYWKPPTGPCNDLQPWSDFRDVLMSMNKEDSCQRSSIRSGPMSTLFSTLRPLLVLHIFGRLPPWETFKTLLPHLGSLTSLRLERFAGTELHIDILLHSCPKLEHLHLERGRLEIDRKTSMGLSSLDLNRGAPGPWVPSPKDKALRLTSLTIKLSEVLLSTLIDILAVCPNLLVLDLLLINTNLKRFRPLDSPTFGESYLMCMIRQACPRLRKFQYSNSYYMFYPIECMLWDMEHITERVIWIGYLKPPLGSLLLRHQNVITSLEFVDIFPKRTLYPEAGGQDLMNTGLHTFLCNAPLLRELKAILVTCSSDRLDPFPWDLKAEPRQRSNWNNTSVSREPRVWACRNLETLELHFTQSHSVTVSKAPRKLVARDVRVVFGYLSRVCPKLRKVHLGLDSARLDLQSGLCLAARLKSLEKLTIEMPGKMSRWSSGLDLSWLDPPQFQEVTTPFHQWEMRNWGPLLQQEQELVERREAFLKQDKTVAVSRGGEYRFADFSQSLALLGTLADVNNCLMQIAESKRHAQARFSWHSYMPAPRVVLIGR